MGGQSYRVVKLQKNRLYPTYQLFALMGNKKTAPEDGMKIAALTVLEWLRLRLGEGYPSELLQPGPEAYSEVSLKQLTSIPISSGFVIDIVSQPEQGVWSLQITEPDLGSDPGNPEQARPAMPGRVIETNIGFRIVKDQLQCGFKTVISDLEGTTEQAEVYRLAVVKRLAKNPLFGLKQLTPLQPIVTRLATVDQIKQLAAMQREEGNFLPSVVFTCVRKETEQLPKEPSYINEFRTPRELRREISAYIRVYNALRPHESLGYSTPDERFQSCFSQVAAANPADLDRAALAC